jgi:SPP1 family predicted phage head-tail adaptor
VRVFIRYVSDLDTSDRLKYKGKTLQIRAIINIEERDRWLELYCEDGVVT